MTLYIHERGTVVGVVGPGDVLCTHNMTLRQWRESGTWLPVLEGDVPPKLAGYLDAATRRADALRRRDDGFKPSEQGQPDRWREQGLTWPGKGVLTLDEGVGDP